MYKNSMTIFSFHSAAIDMAVGNVFTSGAESTLDGGIDIVKKPSSPAHLVYCTVWVFIFIKWLTFKHAFEWL